MTAKKVARIFPSDQTSPGQEGPNPAEARCLARCKCCPAQRLRVLWKERKGKGSLWRPFGQSQPMPVRTGDTIRTLDRERAPLASGTCPGDGTTPRNMMLIPQKRSGRPTDPMTLFQRYDDRLGESSRKGLATHVEGKGVSSLVKRSFGFQPTIGTPESSLDTFQKLLQWKKALRLLCHHCPTIGSTLCHLKNCCKRTV